MKVNNSIKQIWDILTSNNFNLSEEHQRQIDSIMDNLSDFEKEEVDMSISAAVAISKANI
jgi:hypothetical protein